MYNPQLDAFIRVAQLGSFTKAAESFYVTPSAMIQQINNLEKDLGVQLFARTRKGVQLTPAGEYLLKESQVFIKKSWEIRAQVQRIEQSQRARIRVGTYLLHKLRQFGPLWQAFKEEHPDCELDIVDTGAARARIAEVDLIECVKDGEPWQRGLEFLQITTTPIAVAAPVGSQAAQCERLTYDDLKGKTVVTIRRGMSRELDHLGDALRTQGTHVLEVEAYDLSVFSMCEVNGYYLQIPACWGDLHDGMRVIPCDWAYALPYGFFYKPDPQGMLKAFIAFAKKRIEEETGGR